VERAYSLLTVKALDPASRRIYGIASTPEVDRQGDSLDPSGVTYRNPIPLLLHHDQKNPIGTATLTSGPSGITFDAELATVAEPGPFKTLTDGTWQMLTAGVLRGASIGYRILEGGVKQLSPSTRRILKSEICELSLVTVPAHQSATIALVKSLDLQTKDAPMTPTAAERITALETKRNALAALMGGIMDAAPAGESLEPEAAAKYDGLATEVKSLDADVERWKAHETAMRTKASEVCAPARSSFLVVNETVEPGIKLARYVIAKMAAKYDSVNAETYAERRWGPRNDVTLALKAAVAAGSTTDATWAKPLVNNSISSDFIPLLTAATIVGKIPGLYNVPFNVSIPSQTADGTANWVGELKPKPVTSLAFAMENLTWAEVASIVVLSQELIRFSNPKAEAIVRDRMVKYIAKFIDQQFTDPAVAAVAGVNPASITNGAPTAAATASPLADILGLVNHFAANNISVEGLTFLLNPTNALALSFRTQADGSPQFPGIGVNGGTWRGMTFIVSSIVSTNVIALQPSYILYADDGGVTIDASTDASLQMDSAPMSPVDATTVYASMFQMNAVALRAERYINWKRLGTNTVKYLTAANWPSPTGLTLSAQAASDDDAPASKKR